MVYRRHRLRLFGLVAMVSLGVMAFTSSAQALTPKFLVGKKAVVAGLNATVEGKQIGRDVLSVSALNTEFNCEKFSVASGLLVTGTDATGQLLYEECTVLELLPPLQELPCHIYVSAVDKRLHITATGLILPAELTNGEPAVLVEKINAKILMEGAECPLPLENIVKGELCLKIDNNDTVEPTVLGNATIQGECKERPALESLGEGAGFKDKILYGAQTAVTTITAKVFLGGASHKGLSLGVSLQ
jgi:hypothetical protein